MLQTVKDLLAAHGIREVAPLSLSDATCLRPYLLERAGIAGGTAILFLVPYYTTFCADPARNISAYAISRDYHLFFHSLFEDVLPKLREKFPHHRFAGFTDHSPIAEVDAAAKAGLGVRGDNGLLLNEGYGSYHFIGEIVTDANLKTTPVAPKECPHCGACRRACPKETENAPCLSALTQKKGELSEAETALLLKHGTVWGCDICQEVCPINKQALASGTAYTKIPFFGEQALPHLTAATLSHMSEAEFLTRAFAWRGKSTILRNLTLGKSE